MSNVLMPWRFLYIVLYFAYLAIRLYTLFSPVFPNQNVPLLPPIRMIALLHKFLTLSHCFFFKLLPRNIMVLLGRSPTNAWSKCRHNGLEKRIFPSWIHWKCSESWKHDAAKSKNTPTDCCSNTNKRIFIFILRSVLALDTYPLNNLGIPIRCT